MRKISVDEWIKIQNNLKQIDYWQECPPFASFSLAGETHTLYTDGEHSYKSVSVNGAVSFYTSKEKDSET